PRPDHPVPLADRDLAVLVAGPAQGRLDHVGDVPRADRPLSPVEATKFLEHLTRLDHPLGLPLDPDLAVARQHLHTDRVTDLAEVLVSIAENGELFVVTVETDRGFRHALPFVGPLVAD